MDVNKWKELEPILKKAAQKGRGKKRLGRKRRDFWLWNGKERKSMEEKRKAYKK